MAADVDLVKEKVKTYLLEEVEEVHLDDDGDYSFQYGSARTFIGVSAHPNEQSVVVNVFAYVLVDVPGSPELFKYVATHDSMVFGTFLVAEDEDGTYSLILRHRILGDYLDREELLYVALGIASAADDVDDNLASTFGGRVFHP